jgi:hypothetical protein
MGDKTIDEEQVWQEHLAEINVTRHWLFLLAVLAGGTLLMLGVIAWLGSASGT